MKVYIVPNTGKAEAVPVAQRAAEVLLAAGAQVVYDENSPLAACPPPPGACRALPPEEACAACDVMLTVGGDGTMLHAARRAMLLQKPLLGINMGRLGFLTLVESDDLHALARLAGGNYTVEHRSMLMAECDGEDEAPCYALNDIVLFKKEAERTVSLEIQCDDILVSRFRGDGIIFATPTGSTAYSMSAGGPILDAGLDGIVVTQICAHIVNTPPLVLAPGRVVRVAVTGAAGEELAVICDGERRQTLAPGQSACIRRAAQTVPLVQFEAGGQLKSIDTKLKGR